MNLNDFKTPEDLIYWVWKNTKAMPIEEDDEFIPPEKIFEEKRCNCLDIAILMYLYCESKNIECTLADIDMVWKGKDGYNNNGHMVALVKDPHNYGNWSVMQVSWLDNNEKLDGPVFNGNSDKVETLKMFMSAIIPSLENWVTSKDFFKNKNGVIEHYRYFMLEKYHLKQIEEWYTRKDYKEKQKKIWNLMGKDKWVKMAEPVSEANSNLSYSKYTKKYKNFDEFCKVFEDPEDVVKWYRGVKFYWPDKNSEGPFRWPDQLVKEGCGICFDNGIMMHYFCKYHNIENIILELWIFSPYEYNNKLMWMRNGHVTTIFQNKNDGCWYEFDPKDERLEITKGIGSRIRGPYKSQHEAIEKTVEKFGEYYKFLMKEFRNEDIIESKVFYHVWTKDNLKDLDNIYNKKINRDEWSRLFITPTYKIDQSEYLDKEATIKNLDTVQFLKLYAKMYGYKVLNFLNIFKESTEVINNNKEEFHKLDKEIYLNEPVLEAANVEIKKHSLPVDIENFKSDSSRLMCLNTHIPNTIDLWAKFNLFLTAISANSIMSAFVFDPIIFTFCISDQIFAVDIFAVKLNEDGKLDITTEPEGLDVLSINDGEVVFVGEQFKNYDKEDFHMEKRYGNVIVIYHGGCYSIYAHLKEKSIKVKTGDIVKKGEVIAKMGHTGNSACNEPHLHFEMTYTNLTPKSGWKSIFTFEIPKQREGFEDYECTDIGIRTGASLWYDIIGDKEEIIDKFNEKMEICKSGELSGCCFLTNPPKKAIRESVEELDEYEIAYEKLMTKVDYKNTEIKNFDHFCNLCKTPEDTMKWFITNKVSWRNHDNKDKIYWPNDVISRKQGNCWDQAVLMHLYFKKKNIEHRMNLFSIVMEDGKRAGHIYPTFKRGNYIYIWAYLGVGVGFITGPYRDWYEAARMFTDFYKVLLLSDNSFNSVISDETEWSVQDYKETCRIDKRVGENISQQDYMLEDGGDNIWSTHFFSNDFRYIRIPKTKAILYKVYWWAKKHSEKNQDKPMKNESEIKPIKEEYSLSVYTKKYKTMDEFCKTFKTFDDLVLWFQSNSIRWPEYKERDEINPVDWMGEIHWPEDLLRDKIGNCFDQALFAYYFCKHHKIPARMYRMSIFTDEYGKGKESTLSCKTHFFTVVKRKTGYFMFSYSGRKNDTFGPFETYEKCVEKVTTYFYNIMSAFEYGFGSRIYTLNPIDVPGSGSGKPGEANGSKRIVMRVGYFTEKDMEFFDKTYGDKRLTQNEYINHSEGCKFDLDKKVINHSYFEMFKNSVRANTAKAGLLLPYFIASKESTEIIRPTDEDLRAIEYIKESFTDEEKEWFGNNNSDTPDNNPENIAFIKVSYENGRPSGYVELTDSGKLGLAEGDVNLSFAVHKDFRGKGIAKQLIKEAVHWFKESDFTTMSFIVRKGNTASYNLAEKCGFVHMSYWEKTKEDWFMITNPTMLQAIGESSTETEQEIKSPMGICDSVIDYLGSSLDIEKFSDLKSGKRFMYTRCTVMKKDIPLILFLSYCEGLTTVLRKAGVRFMFSDTRPRLKGMDAVNKGVIPFSDGYIIYDKYPLEVSLLMNGLGIIDTKVLAYSEMDSKDVYVNIFETVFGSRILANALDNFYECMIDPVTYTILEELNYPTEFVGLLLAGNKLLADNNFRDELDMANYRIRSNEMAYAYAYKQVATAYSKFRMTANNKNPNKISIPQSVVLKDIMQSQVVEDVSELSPIVEVEKSHILTDKGPSGTNLKEAYNIRRRCFHPSMTGIVAMSQSPDANVGINRAMTMNPNVINARGIVPPNDEKDMDEVNLYGVAELLTPGSMSHDDPTRGSMSVKQAKHIVPVEAASPVLVSNGSEKVLPYHLSSDFVIVAKDDGKVISRDEKTGVAVIEYKNRQGKSKHQVINMNSKVVKNGAGGFYLVNTMNCDKLKKGSTFKKNDILAYNENFFSSSEAEGVRFNIGVLSKVACVSTYISFEDGDFVTDKLSKKLGTDVCMESTAIVGKNSNVSYIVKKGQEVNVNDPLIIYDDSTDDVAFNKMLANIGKDLKEEITRLGKIPVKSKYSGIIEDIKVYTTVEPKSMSPSLRKIVEEHFSKLKAQDAEIMKQTKDGGEEGFAFTEHAEIIDGGEDGKIMGVKVGEGVYFRFFIKYKDYLDVGDKLVHFTAMKYVNAEVVPKGEEPFSLNNPDEEISSIFAPGGVMARMTPSIFKTMYENKVIIELKRKWLEMYQKDNPSFKPKDELY